MAVNPFHGFVGLGDIKDERVRRALGEIEQWARRVAVFDTTAIANRLVSATLSIGADGGTASASAAAFGITKQTRVVSLVAKDLNAATMLHGCRGGWYHVPAENAVGGSVLLRFMDYPAGAQSGSFEILLMEPTET